MPVLERIIFSSLKIPFPSLFLGQPSPGKFSEQEVRPASASGLEAATGHPRTTSVTPGPHTTPSSPFSTENHGSYLRMTTESMISGDVRGKVRTASLEGSESDNSVRSMRSESDGMADTPGQVAAISSTDPTPDTITGLAEAFKPPTDLSQSNGSPGRVYGSDFSYCIETNVKNLATFVVNSYLLYHLLRN